MPNVNDLVETIKKADVPTLWILVSDIAEIMNQKRYEPNQNQVPFVFWYGVYKVLESEIDMRMAKDYMEGEE